MDRPLAPWELEQQAAALAELKGPAVEPEAPASVAAELTLPGERPSDPEALKRAERQLLIQQAERMIADGRGNSSQLQGLRPVPATEQAGSLLPFIRQHSLAIGVGVLLFTFVILLIVMMNFVGRMASGISVPAPQSDAAPLQ